jgi:hypothetical protein
MADRQYLFATNGGYNSVPTFEVGHDGALTLVEVARRQLG